MSKSRKTFIPNNGETMQTSDGHLLVSRRDNIISIRLTAETIETDQQIAEITRDLKFSIHAIKRPILILDLRSVLHMSSRMLGTLVDMQYRVKRREGRMALIRVQPSLMEVLAVTQLQGRLPTFDTFDEALQACSKPPGE